MDRLTDGRTYRRMENLPILQDFVPYRSRCPKTNMQHFDNFMQQIYNIMLQKFFLDESTHSYKKVCLSIRSSNPLSLGSGTVRG